MAYSEVKVLVLTGDAIEAQQPAHGIFGPARGHDGAYGHVDHDQRVSEQIVGDGGVRVSEVQD
jgi:hypothetical protein